MKNLSHLILILIGLMVIGGCLLLFYFHQATEKTEKRLRADLEHTLLPTETDLQTVSSAELRLYKYWNLSRRSPILALPTVDTDRLTEAITVLRDDQSLFLEAYTPEEQALIVKAFHPFAFLERLAPLETSRRTFLGNPTYENAEQYHTNLESALAAHQRDTIALSEVIRDFDDRSIGFLSGVTNAGFIATQLAKVSEQVATAAALEEARFSCLMDYQPECSKQKVRTVSFPIVSSVNPHLAASSSLPETVQRNKNIFDTYMLQKTVEQPYSITDTPAEDLPVVKISNSKCTRNKQDAFYRFFWTDSRATPVPAFWSSTIEDLLFQDVEELQENEDFYKTLYEAGIPYEYHPMNPYFCIDSGVDMTTTATAYYMYEVLKSKTFFAEGQAYQELYEVEQAIRVSEYIDVALIDRFFADVSALIAEIGEPTLAAELGATTYDELHELLLTWRAKSAFFPSILGGLDNQIAGTAHVLDITHIPVDALFISRAYPSTLLLLSNATLFPLSYSLLEDPIAPELSQASIVSYNDYLVQIIPPAQMLEYLKSRFEKRLGTFDAIEQP